MLLELFLFPSSSFYFSMNISSSKNSISVYSGLRYFPDVAIHSAEADALAEGNNRECVTFLSDEEISLKPDSQWRANQYHVQPTMVRTRIDSDFGPRNLCYNHRRRRRASGPSIEGPFCRTVHLCRTLKEKRRKNRNKRERNKKKRKIAEILFIFYALLSF